MSDRDDDREFEDYLEGDSSLSRAWQSVPQEVPTVEMDTAILAAARREAATPSQPASITLRRWAVPLGLAATLVVTVSLVLSLVNRPTQTTIEHAEAGKATGLLGSVELPDALPASEQYSLRTRAAPETLSFDLEQQNEPLQVQSDVAGSYVNEPGPIDGTAVDGMVEVVVTASNLSAADLVPDFRAESTSAGSKTTDTLALSVSIIREHLYSSAESSPDSDAESPPERSVLADSAFAVEEDVILVSESTKDTTHQLLTSIVTAFDAGERGDADDRLTEFRSQFPDHPVSRAINDVEK